MRVYEALVIYTVTEKAQPKKPASVVRFQKNLITSITTPEGINNCTLLHRKLSKGHTGTVKAVKVEILKELGM